MSNESRDNYSRNFISKAWLVDGAIEGYVEPAIDRTSLHAEQLAKWCVDTQEKHVFEGLIKLGWTPPPGNIHRNTADE